MPALFVDHDPWLQPYAQAITQRIASITTQTKRLLGDTSVDEFALGYMYFGLRATDSGWVLREWAPNATSIFLISEKTDWQEQPNYELQRVERGIWEIHLPKSALRHGMHYKLRVNWRGGSGDRLPSYVTYAVQDTATLTFNAVVWSPKKSFVWQHSSPKSDSPPMIYEAHIGMSSEKPHVASYKYFTRYVLPRIKAAGYTTVQLMAIPEHPYYGSFGYHVTNFFAVSSRFGTPDDFKQLVDTAHQLGLRVILDIVHSHAAKNELEGLSRFDGTLNQYFHAGSRGNHPQWDSRVFDYGKSEVAHFLLSNCRFWLDEYHIDGFRFDGVTSMLYTDHGLERAFSSYDDYFGDDIDIDALTYLTLANQLIHTVAPHAITIAEDMSGLPGLAAPHAEGGIGFDYRLNMGVPDLWIKTLKECADEEWDLPHLFHELTSKRPEEQTITYSESHDQALVGDKTLLFRLLDAAMYDHMATSDSDQTVTRGIALIKLIKLLTAATHTGGYLNFMGNEFGHPEWIDFPRAGNDWSYAYARRQWSLATNPTLRYAELAAFDTDMVACVRLLSAPFEYTTISQEDRVISFVRGSFMFVFNFSPHISLTDYTLAAPVGSYTITLSSDSSVYGGYDRVDTTTLYSTKQGRLSLYIPARTALVLRKHS